MNKWDKWNSESATNLWRLLGLLFLSLLWMQNAGDEGGVILLLFLIVMTLARWRFPLAGWTVLLDQVACFIAVIYWPFAVFALALPVFESMYKRQPWYVLPTLLFIFVYPDSSILVIAVFIQAALTGALLGGWDEDRERNQREADRQRRDRYELENLKEELLLANAQGARLAELSERNRIAQQLHDEVGHELTASVLALQAFEHLWKEGDPAASELFTLAQQRLSNSAVYLRETVHNLKPVKELGLEGMYDICDKFSLCPVEFHVFGDTSKVPANLWTILYPTLKEALTNTIRHAKPTQVEISLDISPHILRLSVHNDGVMNNNSVQGAGLGLRNLRHRAKAVGGSISTDTTKGFLLICVLPVENAEQRRHHL
ncbi:sensor histidine kinase [Sutcliffiella horikoshii]|uniref:sensor histidine kinase n=1 Tax=Sutcliffiella horikoshii TaxID=79883 RepID=UPI003850B6E5